MNGYFKFEYEWLPWIKEWMVTLNLSMNGYLE